MNSGIINSSQQGPRRIRHVSALTPEGGGTEIDAGVITDEPSWTSTLARPPTKARATNAAITNINTTARCTAVHEPVLALGDTTEVKVITASSCWTPRRSGPASRGLSTPIATMRPQEAARIGTTP